MDSKTSAFLKRTRAVGSRIGNTPLLELQISEFKKNVRLFGKAEWTNPGGSVKDRPAYHMVLGGFESGQFLPDKVLLDATSGNTGIAYAMLGAAIGFKVKLVLPENVSQERKHILNAYGAEVIYSDPNMSSDGAILETKRLYAQDPEKYFFPDQYNNPLNWQAHYHSTAVEIWKQTEGHVTHFVSGLGTSGTCMGVGRRLKEFNPKIQIIAVEPDSAFHGLEGLKRMDASIVPGIYEKSFPDQHRDVLTEDAYRAVFHLASTEGLLVGISSGAAYHAAIKVCEEIEEGMVILVFPDNADKYLSDKFWSCKPWH
jgi:cysteine synthase B